MARLAKSRARGSPARLMGPRTVPLRGCKRKQWSEVVIRASASARSHSGYGKPRGARWAIGGPPTRPHCVPSAQVARADAGKASFAAAAAALVLLNATPAFASLESDLLAKTQANKELNDKVSIKEHAWTSRGSSRSLGK